MAGTSSEKIAAFIKEYYKDASNTHIEEEFLAVIYKFYLENQNRKINNSRNPHKSQYLQKLKSINTYDAFKDCYLTSLESIIYEVDEEE